MDFFVLIWNSILSIIKTFRWNDIVDIALLTYIVYKGIKIIRETRAQQLLKGLILLVAAFVLAKLLDLKTMEFILKNLFNIGAIAIIIMFQPELRRILDKVGRTKVSDLGVFGIGSDGHQKEEFIWSNAIEAISATAENLSKTKTGALIVIEKQTKLGDQISTGITLNAKPSPELLNNIFFPNSPMHDGAVIIRDGIILAAACYLPKPSKEEYIARQLGSRHRAAIGMSEISDALVVVVSEETGTISIAEDGYLTREYSREELYNTLTEKIIPEKSAESGDQKSAFWKIKKK